MRYLWREVKEKFRDEVIVCFPDVWLSVDMIDHHEGCCRPEQLASVGVPPNCRASLPPGIFLIAGVGLGEILASAGELKLYSAG